MSYILDALNKSEQEKAETKTPGLNTVHQRVERPDSRAPQRWQIIVGVILTLNVAALAAWYFTSGDSAETEMTVQPPPRSSLPAITENTPTATAKAKALRSRGRSPPPLSGRNLLEILGKCSRRCRSNAPLPLYHAPLPLMRALALPRFAFHRIYSLPIRRCEWSLSMANA